MRFFKKLSEAADALIYDIEDAAGSVKAAWIDRLSGKYTVPIKLAERRLIAEISFRAVTHTWDIDYLGAEGSREDVWESLDDHDKRYVNGQINSFTSDILRSGKRP